MEAFSLLKFWKSSSASVSSPNALLSSVSDLDDDAGASTSAGDDGPFFDLEFAGPDSDDDENEEVDEKSLAELVCLDGAGEVEVTEPESGSERSEPNLLVSTSDEVFFSGKILAVESGSDPNSKPQLFPVSLVRSATRLRILMSGFKKPGRSAQAQDQAQPDPKQEPQRKKLFTVKFKAVEVPIVSLFSRDHSSRPMNDVVSSLSSSSSTSSSSSSSAKANGGDSDHSSSTPAPAADEKKNPKDGVQKYFKMVKPLYIRVSKRYGEKLSLSSLVSPASEEKPTSENQEAGKESGMKMQGSLGVGLRVMMKKRLSGKGKSPEVVVHPTAPAPAGGRQRDDSLMQQQEWIQGAILHCKRSFNTSRDEESGSVLTRSASDPSHEKRVNDCSEGQNDVVGKG